MNYAAELFLKIKLHICDQFKDLYLQLEPMGFGLKATYRIGTSHTVERHCLFSSCHGIYCQKKTVELKKVKTKTSNNCFAKESRKAPAGRLNTQLLTQCCHHVVISESSTFICCDIYQAVAMHTRFKIENLDIN